MTTHKRTADSRKRFLVTFAFIAGLVIAAAAQSRGAAPQSRGPGWLPRGIGIARTGSPDGPTSAERAEVDARVAEYERLLSVPDLLARPQGFQVSPLVSGAVADGQFEVSRFSYELVLLDGVVQPGHVDVRERAPALWVRENVNVRNVWIVASGPADFTDANGEMIRERPRGGPLPSMPRNAVVYNGLKFDKATEARDNVVQVLLTSDGQLPWGDVSRERVLNSLIAKADAEIKKIRETFGPLGQTDPKLRELISQNVANANAGVAPVRAKLAAMSPAERAMPAWIQINKQGTYEFAAPGTPGFHHVIADTPDFYRFTGSRVQVRSLLIGFRLSDATTEPRAQEDRAIGESYHGFDWAAAARLLTPRPK